MILCPCCSHPVPLVPSKVQSGGNPDVYWYDAYCGTCTASCLVKVTLQVRSPYEGKELEIRINRNK